LSFLYNLSIANMFSGLTIHVIDPLNRTGKVAIPAHHVTETKGLDDYKAAAAKREAKDFSLCLLFQKGRCNAGTRCHQIHASPEYVTELRAQAAANKNCCAEHGDVHSAGFCHASQTVTVVSMPHHGGGGAAHGADLLEEKRYTLSCFARTAALDSILRSVKQLDIRIPSSKLCRLHQMRRCKFGKDCKNIHLCPDAEELCPLSKDCSSVVTTMSCGASVRSASHPASVSESPSALTPRDGLALNASFTAPLPLDTPCRSVNVAKGALEDSAATTANGCSSFLYYSDDRVWGASSMETSVMATNLDMSYFEETIRSLCADLERAEVSPASALRIRSTSHLFAPGF
jgi:hypothetical protein